MCRGVVDNEQEQEMILIFMFYNHMLVYVGYSVYPNLP